MKVSSFCRRLFWLFIKIDQQKNMQYCTIFLIIFNIFLNIFNVFLYFFLLCNKNNNSTYFKGFIKKDTSGNTNSLQFEVIKKMDVFKILF